MAYKGKCAHGKLKSPVINSDGTKRFCKLKKKTTAGISRDRKHKSKEAHEVRYRKDKRTTKKTVRKQEQTIAKRIAKRTSSKTKKRR